MILSIGRNNMFVACLPVEFSEQDFSAMHKFNKIFLNSSS